MTWQRPQMPAAAAHRVEVDAEPPGGVEHRGAVGDLAGEPDGVNTTRTVDLLTSVRPWSGDRGRLVLGVVTGGLGGRVGHRVSVEVVALHTADVRDPPSRSAGNAREPRASAAASDGEVGPRTDGSSRRHCGHVVVGRDDPRLALGPVDRPLEATGSTTWCRSRPDLARSPGPGCRATR